MTVNLLKFMGLIVVAVALGVLSAAISFGGQSGFPMSYTAGSETFAPLTVRRGSNGETNSALRHIMER